MDCYVFYVFCSWAVGVPLKLVLPSTVVDERNSRRIVDCRCCALTMYLLSS